MTPEQVNALIQTGGVGLFVGLVFYVLRDVRERERRSELREERAATRAIETDKIIALLVSQVGNISSQVGDVTEVLINISATQKEFQIHLQRMALDILQVRAALDRRKIETRELRELIDVGETK
jgi:hypothetical protein